MAHDLRPRRQNIQVARLILFLVTGIVCSSSHADQLLLITVSHNNVNALSENQAAQLFLGLGSSNLKPYDRHEPALRERFYRHTANLSLASVRAHWAKRVFTGRGRPPPIIRPDEINETIRNNPAAVTYIYADQLTPEYKVLLKMDLGE